MEVYIDTNGDLAVQPRTGEDHMLLVKWEESKGNIIIDPEGQASRLKAIEQARNKKGH